MQTCRGNNKITECSEDQFIKKFKIYYLHIYTITILLLLLYYNILFTNINILLYIFIYIYVYVNMYTNIHYTQMQIQIIQIKIDRYSYIYIQIDRYRYRYRYRYSLLTPFVLFSCTSQRHLILSIFFSIFLSFYGKKGVLHIFNLLFYFFAIQFRQEQVMCYKL